jgi:uncharacterized membrane protein YfhO
MKQFAINTASNLLSAAAVVGTVCLLAAPAKADANDVVKGLFAIVLLDTLLNNNSTQHVQPVQQHNNTVSIQSYNNTARAHYSTQQQVQQAAANTVCHSEYRQASNGTIIRYDYNCQGTVLRVIR